MILSRVHRRPGGASARHHANRICVTSELPTHTHGTCCCSVILILSRLESFGSGWEQGGASSIACAIFCVDCVPRGCCRDCACHGVRERDGLRGHGTVAKLIECHCLVSGMLVIILSVCVTRPLPSLCSLFIPNSLARIRFFPLTRLCVFDTLIHSLFYRSGVCASNSARGLAILDSSVHPCSLGGRFLFKVECA